MRDGEVVRLREEHVESLTRLLAGTQRRLDVGEVGRTDVAQARTRLAGARANAVVPTPPAGAAHEPEARAIAPVGPTPNAAPAPPDAPPGAADPFAALRPVAGADPLPPLSSLRPRTASEGDAATERVVVRVTTVPAGALVQHHGRTLGTTPLTFDLARPGTPLDLVLTRGGSMALRTRVERRESRSYVFELTPDKLH